MASFYDSIVMFLAGACVTFVGFSWNRLDIGDKMPPARRETIARSLRIGGPVLMVGAVILGILRALLAS